MVFLVKINAEEILKIQEMHGSMDAWMHVDNAIMQSCSHAITPLPHYPNITPFQHSIIPVVRAANPGSLKKNDFVVSFVFQRQNFTWR